MDDIKEEVIEESEALELPIDSIKEEEEEVFVNPDLHHNEGTDTCDPLLLKKIVDKELIVYTTRIDEMLSLLEDGKVSLKSIEKASKPIMKQAEHFDVKIETSQLGPHPVETCYVEPHNLTTKYDNVLDENEEQHLNKSLQQPRQHQESFKLLSIPLIDFRIYPMLSKEEINRWDVFSKTRNNSSVGLGMIDHVVRIVNICSGFIEIFYMSDTGIIKVHKTRMGSTDLQIITPGTMEIKVCCWYFRCNLLRELYVQLESQSKEKNVYQGLSRYLRHYVILCGKHKCPENICKCCEYCKKQTWIKHLNTSIQKRLIKQTLPKSNKIDPSTLDTTDKLNEQKTAGKTLIAKALAFDKNDHNNVQANTNEKVANQEQPKRGLCNELLEIQHVNKNSDGYSIVNKIEILEIGPNGEIQSYVEKKRPDFIISGLVDTSKKRTTHEVCCWNKLQQVIDSLKLQNVRPEVYQFVRQTHNCPTYGCNCCCSWRPIIDFNDLHMTNVYIEPHKNKVLTRIPKKISVKPINLLVEKPLKKSTKRSQLGSVNADESHPSFAGPPFVTPPVFTIQPEIHSNNILDIREIFVPAGAPVNGHEVNSTLMQSIIDEEITRLIGETNDKRTPNPTLLESIPTTPRLNEDGQPEVPQVTEVNDHIKKILEKFKDLRLSVNPEGRVKAILSHPPDTPDDMMLLKNILKNIQLLLDQQTEKSDEVLASIIRQSTPSVPVTPAPIAPVVAVPAPILVACAPIAAVSASVVNMLAPLGTVYPVIAATPYTPQNCNGNQSTQHALTSPVAVTAPNHSPQRKQRTKQVHAAFYPITTKEPQHKFHKANNVYAPLSLNTTLLAQETQKNQPTDNLFDVLTRPPIPPNFPTSKPAAQDTNIENQLQGNFTCWYREPKSVQIDKNKLLKEDDCLNNIIIEKVESIGKPASPGNFAKVDSVGKTNPVMSLNEIIAKIKENDEQRENEVKRAKLQLERLTNKRVARSSFKASSKASPTSSNISTTPPNSTSASLSGNASLTSVISPATRLTSSLFTPVPLESCSGNNSAGNVSSIAIPFGVPTIHLTRQFDAHNKSSISAETVLIPDDDDDVTETILGD